MTAQKESLELLLNPRNPIRPLELTLFDSTRINTSSLERRTSTLGTRRTVKKQHQAAWLLKAITCIDLTTLAGDDTPGRVQRLCAKARNPVRDDILEALGVQDLGIAVGAVCVYPTMVKHAVKALDGSGIPVASVATGFPAGLTPLKTRLEEIRYAVGEGAKEIDIVITREYALMGQWQALYEEVVQMREACGEAHLKTILATGELGTMRNVYKASMVCMMAGADFIKTSTGKETINATLPVSLVMVRAIREYGEKTGYKIGFKPAGGIRTAKDAMNMQFLMREELGREWLEPHLFRFGASTLLTDIERQLEHFVTGRYSASYRQPMA
jgi:deoxyribose-phosphate aldolase